MRQVYSNPATQFGFLPFDGVPGKIVATVMRSYNARLAHLARRKIAAGVYGARNAGWRMLVGGFLPDASVLRLLLRGLLCWALAEWRNVFLPAPTSPAPDCAPVATAKS